MSISKRILLLLLLSSSCRDDSRPQLSTCNGELSRCETSNNVPYCTFGYKFGTANPYQLAGPAVPGPGIPSGVITYRFQDAGLVFDTHSQEGITSLSFSEKDKSDIRKVIYEWESVANIHLVEELENNKTGITIILANIEQGGLGFPAFVGLPCNQIAGFLVVGTRSSLPAVLCRHELGHVLGLGHVSSENVMNPSRTYDQLQAGDIEGVQSIYGKK